MRQVVFLAVLLLSSPALRAYSVLTHEAIIDAAWEKNLEPLLLKRFPDATPDSLLKAHAYAYGGCIIQDMGYYPFGSKLFSDLVHYVRAGDFIVNLIRGSESLEEYAFALGALAHYAADNEGHPLAVNPAVAIQYPKLERKYGREVTYEDDPAAHLKVEFGFDVLQVARGAYAPKSYHDFIGFEVSKPLLEHVFQETYGLPLKDIFLSLDLALGTYRRSVSAVIPEMTKVAWNLKKDELVRARPGLTRRKFIYNLSRASYRKEWDGDYRKPGVFAKILAAMFRVIPKVGPFKAAALKPPTAQTATMFENSFNRTLDQYRNLLAETGRNHLSLPNRDFDTGELTRPAEYRLADDAYAKLAVKLAKQDHAAADPAMRENILAYFRDLDLPFATRKNRKEWQETVAAVEKLRTQAVAGTPAASAPVPHAVDATPSPAPNRSSRRTTGAGTRSDAAGAPPY